MEESGDEAKPGPPAKAARLSGPDADAPPSADVPTLPLQSSFGKSGTARSADQGGTGLTHRDSPYTNPAIALSALSTSAELKEKCAEYAKVVEAALRGPSDASSSQPAASP